ncbi:hypothetical protein [Acholeplasma equifetale]|uniref:hypothetical protein n=1 Tax=Acholeplasma equifetale TaxID=264634 RepID=UPI00047A82CA|nr:hypothetical protein [Acholeplasma equifetale]
MENKKNTHKIPVVSGIFTILCLVGINIYFVIASLNITIDYYIILYYAFVVFFDVVFLLVARVILTSKKKKRQIINIDKLLDELQTKEALKGNYLTTDIDYESYTSKIETHIDIPRPKEIHFMQPNYQKRIKLSDYLNALQLYLKDFGLDVKNAHVKNFFAMLASNQFVILKHEYKDVVYRFLEVYADFIGAKIEFETQQLKMYELMNHPFFQRSHQQDQTLFILVLTNPNYKELTRLNTSLFPSHFMVVAVDTIDTEVDELNILDKSMSLNLSAQIIEPKESVTQNEIKLSVRNWLIMLNDALENNLIDEVHWKKIDKLESYILDISNYKFGNKIFRQIERYVAILMLCNVEQDEIVDLVLTYKLLPIIKTLKVRKDSNTEQSFLETFETIFGLENLIFSKDLIKDIENYYLNKEN